MAQENTEGARRGIQKVSSLVNKKEAHSANLIDDYEKIKNAALEDKKQRTLMKWIKNKVKYTYIRLNEEFNNCAFLHDWDFKNID